LVPGSKSRTGKRGVRPVAKQKGVLAGEGRDCVFLGDGLIGIADELLEVCDVWAGGSEAAELGERGVG